MKILRFHIGRGGRFHNQGHVSFVKIETIHETNAFEPYFNIDGKFIDSGGNEVDYSINDDGTGYINDDGEYDSDYWVLENSLNAKQIDAIIEEYDDYIASKYPNSDHAEIERILKEHYLSEALDEGMFE
jgi:hypothetical protein